MLNPAKLAWGLAAAVERRGGTILEGSRVTGVRRRAGGVTVTVVSSLSSPQAEANRLPEGPAAFTLRSHWPIANQ